jgi:formylglycine-generating enzyme required for sulfatase activity
MIYYIVEATRRGFQIVSLDLNGIRERLGISTPPAGPKAETPRALSKTLTVSLADGIKMDFVLIPAGTFTMGSEKGAAHEKPVHEVTITKPFYLGVHEVSQAQWKALMGDSPSRPSHFTGDKLPVEQVSWADCQNFAAKVKEKARKGMICRLPTEAEWEYACRAGSKTDYCFGDDPTKLSEYAWYDANSEQKTHPVGRKKPNAWGLYDVHGNVWEWCWDWMYLYEAKPAKDPVSPPYGGGRVLRGGAFTDVAGVLRSAERQANSPGARHLSYGFRTARSCK